MTSVQILFLFFGLPIAILGMGLRRAVGSVRMLLLVLTAPLAGAYAWLVERLATLSTDGLSLPGTMNESRGIGAIPLFAAVFLLASLGALLIRYRGRGSGA